MASYQRQPSLWERVDLLFLQLWNQNFIFRGQESEHSMAEAYERHSSAICHRWNAFERDTRGCDKITNNPTFLSNLERILYFKSAIEARIR
jgi:hypothetical protein